jgi:hypothetical protein
VVPAVADHEATPPHGHVSELPRSSEPSKATKREDNGNGNREHGRQKDAGTASAVQPVESQPPVSDPVSQTAAAPAESSHDSNGRATSNGHGNGNGEGKPKRHEGGQN